MQGSVLTRSETAKWISFIFVSAIAYFRLPEVLLEPRLWAEEGVNYFAFAFNHSWLENLLTPQYGYNTLYNSLATSLAAFIPLEHAPAATTWLAFAFQLGVSAAAIWWNIPLLDTLTKKVSLAIFIQTLSYPRIWVTTIGVQYWLCILTVLILVTDFRQQSRRQILFQNSLLVFNGLTGILSAILFPAFLWKWFKSKSRNALTQTAILAGCLLVQTGIFLQSYLERSSELSIRFADFHPLYVMHKLIRFMVTVPFYERYIFSTQRGETLEDSLRIILIRLTGADLFAPEYSYYFIEMFAAIPFIIFLAYITLRRLKQLDIQLLVFSFISVITVSTYFSINSSSGPRYTFAPSIILMFLLVSSVNDISLKPFIRCCSAGLVILSLAVSLYHYRFNMMGGVAYDNHWPRWKDEVRIWKADHRYPITIWPPDWKMNLSGK